MPGPADNRTRFAPLSASLLAGLLAACWAPPRIPQRAPGQPRLIASGLQASSTTTAFTLAGIDPVARSVTLLDPAEGSALIYRLDPKIDRLTSFHVGDRVKATLLARLTLYVGDEQPSAGALVQPGGGVQRGKVAFIDPSYRVLIVQLVGGRRQTFKLPVEAPLGAIESGDEVALQPDQVVELTVEKRARPDVSR